MKTRMIGLGAVLLGLSSAGWAAGLPNPVVDSDYYDNGAPPPARVELGRMLFFDKIMSGNKNISCATCHSPYLASGDGLSLGIGEGGESVGTARTTGEGTLTMNGTDDAVLRRIGRQAPALFNLGAKEFVNMNWGGVHEVIDGRISSPAVVENPGNLANVLAAQALFPIVNIDEMMGHGRAAGVTPENDVVALAKPGTGRFTPLWGKYLERLRAIPQYVDMFKAAFGEVTSASNITIAHFGNAVAAFEAVAYRSDHSPFDRYLRGDTDALSPAQVRGMDLFYGAAGCSGCHAGKFQTDHKFYAIAVPTIGKGPSNEFPNDDIGRMEKGNNLADKYKFRVPSLRNVAYTAPYGHSGAFATLDAMIRHHLDPVNSLQSWDRTQVVMISRDDLDAADFVGYDDLGKRQGWADANQLVPVSLSDADVSDLIDFLDALTDPSSLDQRHLFPARVPSGLPVGD